MKKMFLFLISALAMTACTQSGDNHNYENERKPADSLEINELPYIAIIVTEDDPVIIGGMGSKKLDNCQYAATAPGNDTGGAGIGSSKTMDLASLNAIGTPPVSHSFTLKNLSNGFRVKVTFV